MPSNLSRSGATSLSRSASLLLLLSFLPAVHAADASVLGRLSPRQLAFARYTVSLFERDPFTESGPVAVLIHASLPDLYKDSDVAAIRNAGANEKADYDMTYLGGDATVQQEVILRYFQVRQLIDNQRVSSVLITPANYEFHFLRELRSLAGISYIYDIKPRKKRTGLIKGQLWIDGATGIGVLVKGRLSDKRGTINFVRETQVLDGSLIRVTHASFLDRVLGRAELAVLEYPVVEASGGAVDRHVSPSE